MTEELSPANVRAQKTCKMTLYSIKIQGSHYYLHPVLVPSTFFLSSSWYCCAKILIYLKYNSVTSLLPPFSDNSTVELRILLSYCFWPFRRIKVRKNSTNWTKINNFSLPINSNHRRLQQIFSIHSSNMQP